MFNVPVRACPILMAACLASLPVPAAAQLASQLVQAAPADAVVMRLTVDDAVRLAAENNLGIQIQRFVPQIQDLSVQQAEAAWVPSLTATMQSRSSTTPSNSFLSGAVGDATTDRSFTSTATVQQTVPWGGNYSVGWDGARSTTNSLFSNFSPQLRSSVSLSYTQQLLRGFRLDASRQQLQTSVKQREIADIQVRETLAVTQRSVRNAYWDLVFAIASLQVQQQSLDLARESLRNTLARIEIGTTPPIDEIAPRAEVARREEAVITAEAQIETAEDALRALILRPDDPGFWTVRIEPTQEPEFTPAPVDTSGAISAALEQRTDLVQARRQLEIDDISIRLMRDQTRPELTADFDYGLAGIGGTQYTRIGGDLLAPRVPVGERSFGAVLGDVFSNAFPTWTTALRISVPVGASPQDASLARARLEQRQAEAQLQNQQLQVATQVRQAARQVVTNQKRVETTRVARELSERTLDAEQRKLAAGISENFMVLQAQRDLAQARNDELQAIIDYQRSVVDLETVQEVPLR